VAWHHAGFGLFVLLTHSVCHRFPQVLCSLLTERRIFSSLSPRARWRNWFPCASARKLFWVRCWSPCLSPSRFFCLRLVLLYPPHAENSFRPIQTRIHPFPFTRKYLTSGGTFRRLRTKPIISLVKRGDQWYLSLFSCFLFF